LIIEISQRVFKAVTWFNYPDTEKQIHIDKINLLRNMTTFNEYANLFSLLLEFQGIKKVVDIE